MRRHVAVACLFCGLLVTAVNAASEADEYGLELDDTLPEEVLPPLEERSHYWYDPNDFAGCSLTGFPSLQRCGLWSCQVR